MNLGQVDPLIFALFLGGLSLLPILLIVCSAFLKISMVLMITRNAMGVQQVPPNMAIYGIALAATLFVMAPVMQEIGQLVKETPPTSAPWTTCRPASTTWSARCNGSWRTTPIPTSRPT
ncbi:hypothetical protein [Billgrantia tianxiuensis]|uniref:hypothetical protein n=1 Tax=Billgrantia tianxiuensis TaxID=2497861 RepID=UPI0019162407|nr:hypothetical protein [Halomonas tianxiuensis]